MLRLREKIEKLQGELAAKSKAALAGWDAAAEAEERREREVEAVRLETEASIRKELAAKAATTTEELTAPNTTPNKKQKEFIFRTIKEGSQMWKEGKRDECCDFYIEKSAEFMATFSLSTFESILIEVKELPKSKA